MIVRNGQRLITGSADSELRVWDIEYIESGVSHDEGHVELSRGKKIKRCSRTNWNTF